ncbi:hypothetical protein HK405_004337 [Cladochytrium tenue]|nr:hypothetical protein HK405_004337 [Cladochytrium tenue]
MSEASDCSALNTAFPSLSLSTSACCGTSGITCTDSRVTYINFTSQGLTSLPSGLASLTELSTFLAPSNKITGSIPSWIGNWTLLTQLMKTEDSVCFKTSSSSAAASATQTSASSSSSGLSGSTLAAAVAVPICVVAIAAAVIFGFIWYRKKKAPKASDPPAESSFVVMVPLATEAPREEQKGLTVAYSTPDVEALPAPGGAVYLSRWTISFAPSLCCKCYIVTSGFLGSSAIHISTSFP